MTLVLDLKSQVNSASTPKLPMTEPQTYGRICVSSAIRGPVGSGGDGGRFLCDVMLLAFAVMS